MGGPMLLENHDWSGTVVADANTYVGSIIHVRTRYDGWCYDGQARVKSLWLNGDQWFADLESTGPFTVTREGE